MVKRYRSKRDKAVATKGWAARGGLVGLRDKENDGHGVIPGRTDKVGGG